LRDGPDEVAVEHACGALAHLVMQRPANRQALIAAGGVLALVGLLHLHSDEESESQAAQYASSILGVIAICGTSTERESVVSALRRLPADVLERFPCLPRRLVSAADDTSEAQAHGSSPFSRAHWAGWLRKRYHRWRYRRQGDRAVPEEFTCPITHELMDDPVVASDGMTYERFAIRQVLDGGSGLSPLTREALATQLYANFHLKRRIASWQHEQAGAPLTTLHGLIGRSSAALGVITAAAAAMALGGFGVFEIASVCSTTCPHFPG